MGANLIEEQPVDGGPDRPLRERPKCLDRGNDLQIEVLA